jgi:hypothetical protein
VVVALLLLLLVGLPVGLLHLVVDVNHFVLVELLEGLPNGGGLLLADVEEAGVLGEAELMVLPVLRADVLAAELRFLKEDIVLCEGRKAGRSLDLDVVVVFGGRSPPLPDHCFEDVAPAALLEGSGLAAHQPQRALEGLGVVGRLGQHQAAVGLLVAQQLEEHVPHPDVLHQSREAVLGAAARRPLKLHHRFDAALLGRVDRGAGVESADEVRHHSRGPLDALDALVLSRIGLNLALL